ncbi:MAG TPA: sigma-70 family RNA polymerase sigma factor [Tissierellaceae bacterium]|nr:sigma-70 family RNA polymerase sigma factor [Tissierellaceae bacterium]
MTELENKPGMYILYDEYNNTHKNLNRSIRELQKKNSHLRDKDRNLGEDYIFNKNMIDITLMNEMSRDLVYSMELMEGHLDYEDRHYTNRKADSISRAIFSQHDLYGLVPDGELEYSSDIDNVEDIVSNVELQEEIIDLLDEALTERQKQVVNLYYFECKTQEQIAKLLGVKQHTISQIAANAIEALQKYVKSSDLLDF